MQKIELALLKPNAIFFLSFLRKYNHFETFLTNSDTWTFHFKDFKSLLETNWPIVRKKKKKQAMDFETVYVISSA